MLGALISFIYTVKAPLIEQFWAMEVKLVVANGKNAGQEIPITGPRFLVGRAEDCQLRPRSDVISRYHCVILVEETFVVVRDFGSKNGTFVNDEQIMGEQELHNGDRLRVGQLEFRVELVGEASESRKPTRGIHEASNGTAGDVVSNPLDLSDWMSKEDSSGTVLGILPLRRATSLDQEGPPSAGDEPKGGDTATDPPKK